MKNISIISLLFFAVACITMPSCENPYPVSCEDGLMNQNEEGVDCGGPCPACNAGSSCTDGIRNGTEISVDCGGGCPPCFPSNLCSDGIQNNGETGIDCGGECENPCNPCEIEVQNNIIHYNRTLNGVSCYYSSADGTINITGSAYDMDLYVNISTPTEIPLLGAYTTKYQYNLGNKDIAARVLIGSFYSTADEWQTIYITSTDPLTVMMCDIEFSGQYFNFTTDLELVCEL